MLNDLPAILAGLLLIMIELIRSIPAYLRVKNTGSSDGVSAASLGVLAGTGVAWVVLAILVSAWWILAANVLWLTIHLMLCWEVCRIDRIKRKKFTSSTLTSVIVFAIAVLVAAFFVPVKESLSIMLGLSALFYAVPAVYEGMISKTTRGLSMIALSVNAIEGLVYLLAGFSIVNLASADSPVLGFIFFGVIAVLSNGARLTRVMYRRFRKLDDVIIVTV